MSASDKSTNSQIEDNIKYIVYEDETINKIFKGLDIETQKKLLKDFPYNEDNKNIHIGIY